MENHLSCSLMSSLQEMSLRRIAVTLLDKPDVLALTKKPDTVSPKTAIFDRWAEEWRPTSLRKALVEISKILPKQLKRQMLLILDDVCIPIKNWFLFHTEYLELPLDAPILENLRWTTLGSIDYRKTAVELLYCKNIDMLNRYKLSCLYCLDEYVPGFWEELPEKVKRTFHSKDTSNFELGMRFSWPRILEEEYNALIGNNDHRNVLWQQLFEFSVKKGNKAATEFFFQKLPCKESKEQLLNAAVALISQIEMPWIFSLDINFEKAIPTIFPTEGFADVFFYLLSVMLKGQRMQILKDFSYHVLFYFVEWQWKEFFFQILDLGRDSLTFENHYNLALKMIKRCKTSIFYHDSNEYFKMFFDEFFKSSPDRFKKSFVYEAMKIDVMSERDMFFRYLFRIPNCAEIISLIFRNVDRSDRFRLVASEYFLEGILYCIRQKNCQMAEECLRDAMLSNKDKEIVKRILLRFSMRNPLFGELECNHFFHLLDATTIEKRSFEIETLTTSKRLRPT